MRCCPGCARAAGPPRTCMFARGAFTMGSQFGVHFAAALVPRKPQVLLIAVGLSGNSHWGQQRELERCPGHAAAVGNPRAYLLGERQFLSQAAHVEPTEGQHTRCWSGLVLEHATQPFQQHCGFAPAEPSRRDAQESPQGAGRCRACPRSWSTSRRGRHS